MPFHKYTEVELRQYCKEYLESLELWLRRVIDDMLTNAYGPNYYLHTEPDGNNLISSKIKVEIQKRIDEEPERFPRPIDACLLESEIKIITNPKLYTKHFKDIFHENFPEGKDELLTFLNRLIEPRNKLYHANPLSVRDAERVICYTNDIIDSIKHFYLKNNMSKEFNVPLIIKYSDSFGNTFYRNQFHGKTLVGYAYVDINSSKDFYLRPGDKLSMEIEVDPTFSKDEYQISWRPEVEGNLNNSHYAYTIQNKDVGESFCITVSIKSNKDWHRLNDIDDSLVICFKVLPPLF